MSRTITSTTSGMAVGAYARHVPALGVLHATDLVSSQVMLDRFGEVGTGLWALIAVGGGTLAVAGALIALTSTLRGLKIEGIGIVGLLVSIGGYLAALITAQGLDGPMTTIMLLASLVLGLVLRGVQVIGDIRISRRELGQERRGRMWWQTVADTLTGLAAVAVALSGLILSVKKLFGRSTQSNSESTVPHGQAAASVGMTETERQYLKSLQVRSAEVGDLRRRLSVARNRLAEADLDISDI